MFDAGVRAHYYASQLAARSMVARRRGLILNISFSAARKHIGHIAYDVSKAATDKMIAAWLDLSNSESPEFIGRAVIALGADCDIVRHTGTVLVAVSLGT